jgi:hypothetical protein
MNRCLGNHASRVLVSASRRNGLLKSAKAKRFGQPARRVGYPGTRRIQGLGCTKRSSLPGGREDLRNYIVDYGLGDELVLVEVEVLVPGDEPVFTVVLDEFEPPEGDDLSMTVVLLSLFFSPGGLATVVSFCSHAARKAMLIKMQMYFMVLPESEATA